MPSCCIHSCIIAYFIRSLNGKYRTSCSSHSVLSISKQVSRYKNSQFLYHEISIRGHFYQNITENSHGQIFLSCEPFCHDFGSRTHEVALRSDEVVIYLIIIMMIE